MGSSLFSEVEGYFEIDSFLFSLFKNLNLIYAKHAVIFSNMSVWMFYFKWWIHANMTQIIDGALKT